jgi:hypothetical protein
MRDSSIRLLAVVAVLFLALWPVDSYAVNFRLFYKGNQVAPYDEIITYLTQSKAPVTQPTYLLFDNDPPVEIVRFLGKGALTAVFERADGRVIRVPLKAGNIQFGNGPIGRRPLYTDKMRDFLTVMRQVLSVDRNLAPRIYEQDSHPPEYLTVDKFENKFDLYEFLKGRGRAQDLSPQQRKAAMDALQRFVVRLAPFKHIGDFRMVNIVSNGTSWRIMDADWGAETATSVDDPTPFDSEYNMREWLSDGDRTNIENIIRSERYHHPEILHAGSGSCDARYRRQ